jgi:hypothetical protein
MSNFTKIGFLETFSLFQQAVSIIENTAVKVGIDALTRFCSLSAHS